MLISAAAWINPLSVRFCIPVNEFIIFMNEFVAMTCPSIRPPLNGMLQLPCFQEYNSTCTVKCKKGFVLSGNENINCGLVDKTVAWINHNATCNRKQCIFLILAI